MHIFPPIIIHTYTYTFSMHNTHGHISKLWSRIWECLNHPYFQIWSASDISLEGTFIPCACVHRIWQGSDKFCIIGRPTCPYFQIWLGAAIFENMGTGASNYKIYMYNIYVVYMCTQALYVIHNWRPPCPYFQIWLPPAIFENMGTWASQLCKIYLTPAIFVYTCTWNKCSFQGNI
jgi:hypothetical protein